MLAHSSPRCIFEVMQEYGEFGDLSDTQNKVATEWTNILFICSCYEPGCDGVGDYVRTTIRHLPRHFRGRVLAIADRYVNEVFEDDEAIRVPAGKATMSAWFTAVDLDTVLRILERIRFNGIAWVSFHYVPYAYSVRGLPFALGCIFDKLAIFEKHHVFVHEISVGLEEGASSKDILLGGVQRALLRRLLSKIPGVQVETSNVCYEQVLAGIGVTPKRRDLIATVPVNSEKQRADIDCFTLGIFAGLDGRYPMVLLVKLARELKANVRRRVRVSVIGRSGDTAERIHAVFRDAGIDPDVYVTGPLESGSLADEMGAIDLGLPTVPFALWQKSSVVFGFLANEVPLLFLRDDWCLRGYPELRPPKAKGMYLEIAEVVYKAKAASLDKPERMLSPNVAVKRFIDENFAANA